MREDQDFSDVTLACEDGQQVEAHKVILVASSPFFQRLLGRNKHPHPLIYMRGIKSVDIVAIIDFLYCGEAAVYQENLDSFLTIAEELELMKTWKTLLRKGNFQKLQLPKKKVGVPKKFQRKNVRLTEELVKMKSTMQLQFEIILL